MNNISDKIFEILTKYVGEIVARTTMEIQCGKLYIDINNISEDNLIDLADKISSSLVYFSGTEVAGKIKKEILDIKTTFNS